MIRINTFSGQPFQTIHVNENDTTYTDLLKYIKIQPHPKYPNIDNIKSNDIGVKQYVKLYHIINSNVEDINLDADIDFDKEITLGFYYEYYGYTTFVGIKKLCDDFTLPKCDTPESYKNLIRNNAFNIIFIPTEMLTDELYRLAIRQNYNVLKYITNQTEEICKFAVQEDGLSLGFVKNQTEEIGKLAVQQNCYVLQYVKNQTEEICKICRV